MREKIRKFLAIMAVEFEDMQDGMSMLLDLAEERFKKHEITGYVWTENSALLRREKSVIKLLSERIAELEPETFATLDDAVVEVRRIIRGLPGIPQAVPDFIDGYRIPDGGKVGATPLRFVAHYEPYSIPNSDFPFPRLRPCLHGRMMPAIVPVMNAAREPPIMARRPIRARSARREGAMPPMPPIWIPIEAKFAKPHSA